MRSLYAGCTFVTQDVVLLVLSDEGLEFFVLEGALYFGIFGTSLYFSYGGVLLHTRGIGCCGVLISVGRGWGNFCVGGLGSVTVGLLTGGWGLYNFYRFAGVRGVPVTGGVTATSFVVRSALVGRRCSRRVRGFGGAISIEMGRVR